MFRSNLLRAAVALALCAPGAAFAEDAAKLFAKAAEYQEAHLSPTGAYVAVTTPFEDRRALSMIKLSGEYERSLFKFGAQEQPYNIHWLTDNRLMVQKAKDYGMYGSLVGLRDIYAVDADGKHDQQLFGYVPDAGNVRSFFKDEGMAYFMKVLPDTPGDTLFYFMPWTVGNSKSITSVYRVDTNKGSRKQIDSFDDSVEVDADNKGNLRFNTRWDLQGNQHVQYRPTPDSAWKDAPDTLVGHEFGLWFFDADNNHAYAEISDHGEPATLYRIDVAAGTREKLSSHPTLEISNFERAGHSGPPVVLSYTSGKPKIDYLDPKSPWAQLHAGLMKAFTGQMVEFVDVTKDDNTILLYVYSDRNPGTYYLFDRKTNAPTLLFQTREWIDPAKMASTLPIEFKNRGGDTLYSFLTIPNGKSGALPLVVMPHGGPFGISDHWGFDNDAQFLASLGYAVLQVNYRGSGNRGDKFETSAYRQWGTGIQDDIADAVKNVIAQGMADPNKVCIYGVSFGGYSAMMNPIRNPGMYKCSIAYAGVYDLADLYKDKDSSRQGRAFFERTLGDVELQRAQSPVAQIDKLDVPLLLIHGKSDHTAPFAQFNIADSALKKSGKTYETLAKADEGHGFYKEANRVEAYQRIQDFLLKYNPPN